MEGVHLGKVNVLILQLQKRFSTVPEWAISKVENATEEQLDRWIENILDAKTLEDVFKLED